MTFWRREKRAEEDHPGMIRAVEAEKKIERIRERAEHVVPLIEDRHRRNCWGETAAMIARRDL